MAKYIVNVKSVWSMPVEIEAKSAQQARELVDQGKGINGEKVRLYYLESDTWTVRKIK